MDFVTKCGKNWIRNHDTILYYVKTPGRFTFNKEYIPHPAGYERRGGENPNGKGYPIEDVWNANTFEFNLKGEDSLDSIQIKVSHKRRQGMQLKKMKVFYEESLMLHQILAILLRTFFLDRELPLP